MAELQLSNVVNISVAATPNGVNAYNTSNVALFSYETPDPVFDDGYKIYKEPVEVGDDFGTASVTYQMALAIFSQQPNILGPGGYLVVITMEASETIDEAIARSSTLVQWFGGLSTAIETAEDTMAGAAVVQTLNKLFFWVQRSPATIEPSGLLDDLTTGGFTQSRGLYYGSDNDTDALVMSAAYAGRGLSVDFSGSNTTITMHLKDLTGIQPDDSLDQTALNKAIAAGADTYPSLQGVPKVFCSGENNFFDQVYNLRWFVGALEVAGFNYLAQSATKIPQTESGIDGLKGAYRAVCEQAKTNQYVAPGTWNSPTTFGVQADLYENVAQRGYYIYSLPISQQLQVAREARQAPLIQIAVKEAGAEHSSSVIVYVNA